MLAVFKAKMFAKNIPSFSHSSAVLPVVVARVSVTVPQTHSLLLCLLMCGLAHCYRISSP